MDVGYLVRQKEPMADPIPNSKSYLELLAKLKEQIRTAQVKAALAVNNELVLLYWRIGSRSSSVRRVKDGEARSLSGLPKICCGVP
jgi:hypothetical protein